MANPIPQLKPRGQRPRCLHCGKELLPRFNRQNPPYMVKTGETQRVRQPGSFGSEAQYVELPVTRTTTEAERKQFRKDNPPEFTGKFGGYGDNRFCGLNCGYQWAVAHTKPQS